MTERLTEFQPDRLKMAVIGVLVETRSLEAEVRELVRSPEEAERYRELLAIIRSEAAELLELCEATVREH